MGTRFDIGELRPATELPNGWLRADAYVTRAGVFEYRRSDGTVRRELRPLDEVFAAESLASLQLVPVTLGHPPVLLLDAQNAKQFTVGHVGDSVQRDSALVRAPMLVTDAAAIAALKSGQSRETSCGYVCDFDPTPGEWNGQRYDGVQRNIRYNHVAIVPQGRAGPEVRVRVDGDDSMAQVGSPVVDTNQPGGTVVKIKIDGVEYEGSEQLAQAIARHDAAAEKALDDVKAKLDKSRAKFDALDAEMKKVEAARADAADPKKLQTAVRARVQLERTAESILGSTVKLDAMDDEQIRREVVKKLSPEARLDGVSADYLAARFDAAVELHQKAQDPAAKARAAAGQGGSGSDTRNDAADPEAARKRMLDAHNSAWKGAGK